MRRAATALGAVLLVLSVAGPVRAAEAFNAKTNYILYCQGCHGADGVGVLTDQVPPLANAMGYFLHAPAGRAYLIQVPGAAYAPVDDGQLANLLNYALRRFSAAELPANFLPYSREEVARERRSHVDIVSLRAELVAEITERLGVRLWTLDNPTPVSPGARGPDAPE
ncbi:MAG: hypothetical protein OXQ29_21560 [Rhodospirillaceae bacterium]|nr:hypothetical protein [Rhodospirillaceae bacterium]